MCVITDLPSRNLQELLKFACVCARRASTLLRENMWRINEAGEADGIRWSPVPE